MLRRGEAQKYLPSVATLFSTFLVRMNYFIMKYLYKLFEVGKPTQRLLYSRE